MSVHDIYSSLSPIYRGGLTNHLPMMITALTYLDVEEETIKQIAKEYVEEKGIFDLNEDIVKTAFDEEYVKITNFYLHEIQSSSIENIIHIFLNKHRYSLHSGLFHGLIRLAYAYMEESELLVAQALSYFEMILQDSKLVGEGVKKDQLGVRMETLIEHRRQGVFFAQKGSMNKYQTLQKEEFIREHLFFPIDILKSKTEILELFLEMYNKTNDFYILHVLTGYHALHILSQFFIEEVSVWRNFFMQALIIILFTDHDEYVENDLKGEFFELVKGVKDLRDAHDIKLFFSLVYFYDKYNLDELKISASRLFK